jgi:hypothetical protein
MEENSESVRRHFGHSLKCNRSISPRQPFSHNIVCVIVVFLIVLEYLLNELVHYCIFFLKVDPCQHIEKFIMFSRIFFSEKEFEIAVCVE